MPLKLLKLVAAAEKGERAMPALSISHFDSSSASSSSVTYIEPIERTDTFSTEAVSLTPVIFFAHPTSLVTDEALEKGTLLTTTVDRSRLSYAAPKTNDPSSTTNIDRLAARIASSSLIKHILTAPQHSAFFPTASERFHDDDLFLQHSSPTSALCISDPSIDLSIAHPVKLQSSTYRLPRSLLHIGTLASTKSDVWEITQQHRLDARPSFHLNFSGPLSAIAPGRRPLLLSAQIDITSALQTMAHAELEDRYTTGQHNDVVPEIALRGFGDMTVRIKSTYKRYFVLQPLSTSSRIPKTPGRAIFLSTSTPRLQSSIPQFGGYTFAYCTPTMLLQRTALMTNFQYADKHSKKVLRFFLKRDRAFDMQIQWGAHRTLVRLRGTPVVEGERRWWVCFVEDVVVGIGEEREVY